MKQADSTSKETEFSGLPKAAKLYSIAGQIPAGAGVGYENAYAALEYNYGPFVPVPYVGTPSLYRGFSVSEPGLYDIVAQVAVVAGNQSLRFSIQFPVIGVLSPTPYEQTVQADCAAGIETLQVRAPSVPLNTGDLVTALITQGAPTQNTFATYSWLQIEKRGGQY